jgi:hypothetical protein
MLSNDELREQLRQALAQIDPVGAVEEAGPPVRRRGVRIRQDRRALTLIEDDGVLLWQPGLLARRQPLVPGGRLRGLRRGPAQGSVIHQVPVRPLEPSKLNAKLIDADLDITPNHGLLEVRHGAMVPLAPDWKPGAADDKILLFVHGFISQGKPMFDQLGKKFFSDAAKQYKRILIFNHPTLSMSPMLNALDLSRRLATAPGAIDVICHSRGGLVTRWWLEEFDRPRGKRRAVVVGSPLGGTTLAAAPAIRHLMSWFSNLAKHAATAADFAGDVIPFVKAVGWLAQLTALAVDGIADSMLVDATIGAVPGVNAMSRVSNNLELQRLKGGAAPDVTYYVVQGAFKPADPGWQRFWEYFNVESVKHRALGAVFDGRPNDLIVDTDSMAELRKPPAGRLEYQSHEGVHHTNYFAQPRTQQSIRTWLGIP